jgi:hypothetical protein
VYRPRNMTDGQLLEWIESHCKSNEAKGCIEWQGSTNGGYGRTNFKGKAEMVHRLVWYLNRGFWPRVVCHKCDNPSCCNIAHLSFRD